MADELTPEQLACPHRTITQIVQEEHGPRQGWTCDACGTQLVTLHQMLEVVRAIGKAWTEVDL